MLLQKSVAPAILLYLGCALGMGVHAQMANSPFANSGAAPSPYGTSFRTLNSVRPEWWTDFSYVPERLEGALHLRVGGAGSYNGKPSGGRPNCDMAMLYAAKANAPLSAAEMEYCALQEFEIFKGLSDKGLGSTDNRNINDSFVRRDTVAQFSENIKKRIELFRKNSLYYIRAASVQFDPFDVKQGSLGVRVNWTQSTIPFDPKANRPDPITYKFDEPRFRKDEDRWWAIRIPGDEKTGRELETARVKERFFTAQNYIIFEVTGASEAKEWNGITRYIKVRIKRFAVPYTAEDGRPVYTGVTN
jgi:hypothetical protein